MLLPALAQLQRLTLGLVTVADGGLQRLAIFTSLAELRIPVACSSLVVEILPGTYIQALAKPAVALLCTSKTPPNPSATVCKDAISCRPAEGSAAAATPGLGVCKSLSHTSWPGHGVACT